MELQKLTKWFKTHRTDYMEATNQTVISPQIIRAKKTFCSAIEGDYHKYWSLVVVFAFALYNGLDSDNSEEELQKTAHWVYDHFLGTECVPKTVNELEDQIRALDYVWNA